MTVYRLANARRADDLLGTRARLGGGRWNRIGAAVLYTAGSRALAAFEVLVHAAVIDVPNYYQMLTLLVPEDSMLTVPLEQLPTNWNEPTPPPQLAMIAEKWIDNNPFLVLKVPSAVIPGDYNFLLNPAHRRMSEVKILNNQPFQFDTRPGKA